MTSASAPFHSLRQTLCHASRTFLLAFALLCLAPRAMQAQTAITTDAELRDAFTNGGDYTLTTTIAITGEDTDYVLPSGKTLTITGPGTIERGLVDAGLRVEGGTLNMTDITFDGASLSGPPALLCQGTLNLNRCTITNCTNSGPVVAGLYLNATSATLTDCHITNNEVWGSSIHYGCAMTVINSTVTINGGSINNNRIRSTYSGSTEQYDYGIALYIKGESNVTMEGVTVSGNRYRATYGQKNLCHGVIRGERGDALSNPPQLHIKGCNITGNCSAETRDRVVGMINWDPGLGTTPYDDSNKYGLLCIEDNIVGAVGDSTRITNNYGREHVGIHFVSGLLRCSKTLFDSNRIYSSDSPSYNPVGGGIYVKSSDESHYNRIEIENCTFKNNYGRQEGGGVFIERLTYGGYLRNCVFKANNAGRGAGMYLVKGFPYTAEAATYGLELSDLTFTGNLSREGAGIYILYKGGLVGTDEQNALTLTNCNMTGNWIQAASVVSPSSAYYNGTLTIKTYGSSNKKLTTNLQNVHVDNNFSAQGGGSGGGCSGLRLVDQYENNEVVLNIDDDCTINGNEACLIDYEPTGGLYANGKNIKINGGTIRNNQKGYGLKIVGNVYLSGLTIDNNDKGAVMGGGDCNMHITDCIISNNGSGVLTHSTNGICNLCFSNCSIINNGNVGIDVLTDDAPAFSCSYHVTMDDCTINGNSNSGVFIRHNGESNKQILFELTGATSIINNSTTTLNGGGICCLGGSLIVSDNCTISNNTTTLQGGGVYINNTTPQAKFIGNITIGNNTAGSYGDGQGGGGIYVQGRKNTVGTTDDDIPVLLDGVTLSGNTAHGRGGGLYVAEEGAGTDPWKGPSVLVRNCNFTGNMAKANPSASTHDLGNGGGIYAHGSKLAASNPYTDGYLKVIGGTIAGNQALRNGCTLDHYCIGNGGGVYAYSGTVMLSGVNIGSSGNANSADRNGGGVFVNEHADVTINGATNIAYNTAVNGAGIYTLGNLTMDGSTFTVSNNTATGYGGGINISHADVNDPEEIGFLGTMSYSIAPGEAGHVDPGTFNYKVYNASDALVGDFPFDGSDYEDLLAPGTYTVRLSKTDGISDFSSLASLTLVISDIDGSITPNGGAPIANETDITFTTFTDGYEICTFEVTSPADLGGTLTMKNGTTLSGNSAAYGGGLFVGTHTTAELQGATIGGSTADKNTATTKGGGVYKLGTLKVGGGGVTVTDNQSGTAKAYVTDNVYIPTTAAEPYVLVSGTFDCGSSIGITKTKTDHTYLDDDNYTAVRTVVATNETPGSGHAETAFRRNVFFDDTDKYRVWSFNFAQSSDNYTEDNCYFIETWRSFANASDFTGSGPYEVSSAAGLAYLAQQVNNGTNYVGTVINQTTDLDLSGHYWEPVGTSDLSSCGFGDNAFAGTYNGNGHFIYNASCTQLPLKDLGLFGNVTGTLKHVFALGSNFTYILDEAGGGLGGIVGKTTGLIDGCEASGVTLTGSATAANTATAGGIAGKVASGGEVRNSFAVGNTIALGASGSIASAGGLAGSIASGGAVRNCYAKNNTLDGTAVGALVGNNEGTLSNCYSNATTGNLVGTGTAGSNVYAAGATDATYTYTATIGADNLGYQYADNTVNSVAMFKQLSANATALGAGYAQWARPSLAEINGDLPVLMLDAYDGSAGGFSSVGTYNGSADVLQYGGTVRDGDQLNSALTRTGTGTNCLFVYGDVTAAPTTAAASYTQSKVSIYEHASITAPGTLKDFAQTYVGVTFDNAAADAGVGAMSTDQMNGLGSQSLYRDWHMLSSPLSNAPIGFDYGSDNNGSGPQHNPWTGNDSWTRYWMHDYASADGYFPTSRGSLFTEGQVFISGSDEYNHRDVYQYGMDLYCWSEPDYHWINFKRNGNDHWSSEEPHNHIDYFGSGTNVNEGYLLEGKGYLASICKETFLQSHGSLNSGTDFKTRLNLTKNGAKCTGWNLVGNPFHSYLSFDALATANTAVLGTDALYVVYEAEGYNTSGNGTLGNGYLYYPYSGSPGGAYARPYLHPHQGFFVFAESEGKLTFNESTMAMSRATVGANGNFRENRAAYPLVNLFLTSEHGCSDVCVVEFNRPEWGGAYKQKALRMGNGQLYAYHDGNEYAALFATAEAQRIPVYFEAKESDTYTLHWNTANGDFSQLILVDNMTGVQYDMLRNDSYSFSGTEDDYKSRFYICFAVLGMDEFEDDTSPGGTTFAFFDGSQWVVTNTGNGPAQLDLIDLQGRVLHRATLGEGGQTRVSLPEVAKGMYLLRRSSANGTQVQKIIIK